MNENLLSTIIDLLRLESAFVSFWKMAGEWSFAGPKESCALLHYVAQGQILISIGDETPTMLNQGDMAIFPNGIAHRIGNSTAITARPLENILPYRSKGEYIEILYQGDHQKSAILCAGLHHDDNLAAIWQNILPEIIVIRKEKIEAEPLLYSTIQGLLREIDGFQDGRNFTLYRGLELIYVLGLWIALGVKPEAAKKPYALRDHRIARALLYMHKNYHEDLSVAQIALAANMSRSAFSPAFRNTTGHSPAHYLSKVRVSVAKKLQRTTRLTQDEIASRVGFKSSVGLYLAIRSMKSKDASVVNDASASQS